MAGNYCIILSLFPASLAHPLYHVFLICFQMCYNISYIKTKVKLKDLLVQLSPLFIILLSNKGLKRVVHIHFFQFLYSTSLLPILAPAILNQDC